MTEQGEWTQPAIPDDPRQHAAFGPDGPRWPLPPVQHPARPARSWRAGFAGLLAGAVIGGGAGAGAATLLAGSDARLGMPATAQSIVITNPQSATDATAAAAKAAPSVVTIYVSGPSDSGSGSGIVLTDDGYVLTNNHVVSAGGSSRAAIQVRVADGTLYDATIVGTDPTADLAVIELADANGLTPATFADSDDVQVGDLAVAIGAPLGLSNTVTNGIISATDRAVATGSDQEQTVINALQTDAAINPGNSGGALVDAAGEVIGVNTAIATVASGVPGQQSTTSGNIGVGFAIPSNTAQRIAQEIILTGSATHALLGVSARTASEQNSAVGTGAELAEVQDGGPADDAGLRVGDVITAVGDRAVSTSTELTAAVRSARPGDRVTVTVRRDGETSTVQATLDSAGG